VVLFVSTGRVARVLTSRLPFRAPREARERFSLFGYLFGRVPLKKGAASEDGSAAHPGGGLLMRQQPIQSHLKIMFLSLKSLRLSPHFPGRSPRLYLPSGRSEPG
jgi:hypothetical protein